jgi:hypothetical protein
MSREWCLHAAALSSRAAFRVAFGVLSLPFVRHESGWQGSTYQFSRATRIPRNGRLLTALRVIEKAGLIQMRWRRGLNGLSIRVVDPWLESADGTVLPCLDGPESSPRSNRTVLRRKQDSSASETGRFCVEKRTLLSPTEDPEDTEYPEYPEKTLSPKTSAEPDRSLNALLKRPISPPPKRDPKAYRDRTTVTPEQVTNFLTWLTEAGFTASAARSRAQRVYEARSLHELTYGNLLAIYDYYRETAAMRDQDSIERGLFNA